LLCIAVASALSISSPSSGNNNNNNNSMSALTRVAAVGKLHPGQTALLLCDVQERFGPLIFKMPTVVQTCQYMTSVAAALEMPILVSQQYTKVFGATLPDCFATKELQEATPVFEKKKFSMLTDDVVAQLSQWNKKSYILVGIETHVCVQQTCLDLLQRGEEVHIVVDGVSSQQPLDRQVALQRMQAAGAYLTTAQSAAFMLLQSADHPNFKAVSKLTVAHMKLPNEFNDKAASNGST
jgi:nicotinamidase-related amidase